MKRYISLVLLFISLTTSSYAQKNEQCLGKIVYVSKLARLNNNDSLRYSTYENELLFGKYAALWGSVMVGERTTFKGVDTAELFKNKKMKEYIYNMAEKILPPSNNSSCLLKKYSSQILYRQQIDEKKQRLIIDTLPKINWQIFENQKTILNYICQKAMGKFRGRTYIVWFTKELPLPTGPWKLNGLPGIILAANDDKNEVFFEAIKIKMGLDGEIPIKLDGEIVTADQYSDIVLKSMEKTASMVKASGNGRVEIRKVAQRELTKN